MGKFITPKRLETFWATAVNKLTEGINGKKLSSNDLTDELKEKYDKAESNKIDSISVNGEKQTIDTDKNVNIEFDAGTGIQDITQEEYDALSEEEKMGDTIYHITDAEDDNAVVNVMLGETSETAYAGDKGKALADKIGDTDISTIGDGTVSGAINAVNENKLGKTETAASASKLSNTNAIGSATKPVYFNENGVPVAGTYELNKTVPSDAVFTDTTYSVATTEKDGLMSAEDKTIVNSVTSNYCGGKNYAKSLSYERNGLTSTITDDLSSVHVTGIPTILDANITVAEFTVPAGTYTFWFTNQVPSNVTTILFWDGTDRKDIERAPIKDSYTYSFTKETEIVITLYRFTDTTTPIDYTTSIMCEKGNKKTTYEPYIKSNLQLTNESNILSSLTYPNAGAHNSIYRGKNLGTSYTAEQKAQIQAGTFNDLYIGDYWVIDGVTWRIAHFDYWLHCGDTECTNHHVVIVPDMDFYTAKMNDTDTTTGAYVGSAMYTANLATAKTTIENAFGSANILTHREYLTNATKATADPAYESAGSWYDSTVELMNECMVYGSNIYHNVEVNGEIPINYTIDKSQLALFRLDPSKICNRHGWWLRDVVSAASFAYVVYDGAANCTSASRAHGVRPAFGIC